LGCRKIWPREELDDTATGWAATRTDTLQPPGRVPRAIHVGARDRETRPLGRIVCSEFPGLGDAHLAVRQTPSKVSGRHAHPDRCGNPRPGCRPAKCSASERVPDRRRRAVVVGVRRAGVWPVPGFGFRSRSYDACGGRYSGFSVGRRERGRDRPSSPMKPSTKKCWEVSKSKTLE
jgi:hypothetical protein